MARESYPSQNITDRSRDNYLPPRKRLQPRDVLVRAATAELRRNQEGPDKWERTTDAIARIYAGCPATMTYAQRAATSPANTTTVGWAAELVDQSVVDFMATDMARQSGFAQLAQRAMTIALEPGISSVKIPSRSSPISLMGSWVGESAAKPVYAGSLTTSLLQPYKLAAVSVFSEEMVACTAIEQIVRETLVHDLSALLDTALFDATAVSALRPAGLFNGATAVTASALTPANEAMLADLKALAAAVNGTGNPDASVVFVVNPAQAMRIGILAPGYDNLIVSGFMTAGTVGATDVGGVAMLVGQPEFKVSNSAAIHMDTVPLPLATGVQGSGVIATPMSSAFQQDLVALRISLKTGWIKRRAAATALATSVVW